MKTARLLVVLLSVAAGPVFAQQQGAEISGSSTNAANLRERELVNRLVQEEARLDRAQGVVVKKNLEFSGPLVRPLKAKKMREFSGHLLQLVNPFAPVEPKEEIVTMRGLSPRAWSTSVGWSAGRSAFPDATTHDPSLGLVSVTRVPKPSP